ncbi:hypothetical protein QN400_02230 [Pseudomonas sp. RTC3]|uniref:hypothetical protein n=1 Tax=unclassified Pseudomonas TaxID=196821 RepID=UPI002AB5C57F|nr:MULTISPECIES: hypothetical protein [unclassified Pseudomonas]MEB0060843.1 hypothetical protein [Pseudomonas sp. RTC3]MDY7563924.1 hypothetical protein [Pseudomonas sp. 5C2]MEB0005968.1 hypothetical protein [Pseudomonas sp. RTB2]MEB0018941.1 hypothetical protein [Pseudomonas sp. RTB3]MEB0025560.1 hypothetical protein [Pseudomonas sp. MH9.2]
MNIALSFLNAAALVALVTFQFQGNSSDDEQISAQVQTHHLMQQASHFAVMTDQSSNRAMLTNDSNDAMPLSFDRSERWVF